MKTMVKIEKEVDIKKVVVSVPVRYGDECMAYDAPGRDGDNWKAAIDLDTHTVLGWPQGVALDFCLKVVDGGTYTLFDEHGQTVAFIEQNYVPNRLLPGDYGDYLELNIDENGVITNWLDNPDFTDFFKSEN